MATGFVLPELLTPAAGCGTAYGITFDWILAERERFRSDALLLSVFHPAHMDVVQLPPLQTELPDWGHFVIVSIDPIASVADLKDDIATAAASKIPRGKYLALVKGLAVDPDVPYLIHPLSFQLIGVGHGLPDQPYACIPLSPGLVHPEGHPPLLPDVPLPWPDCFLHLLTSFNAMITRLHPAPAAPVSAIPVKELRNIILARNKAEKRAFVPPLAPIRDDDAEDLESGSDGDEPEESAVHSFKAEDEIATSGSVQESSGSVEAASPIDYTYSNFEWPRKVRLRAELWCDLRSSDDFRQPWEIIQVRKQLEAIEAEWAKRAVIELLVDRPRTSQWATDVANANPPVVEPDAVPHAPLSDDGIAPEDAVEHRNAQAGTLHASGAAASANNGSLVKRIRSRINHVVHSVAKPANRLSKCLFSRKTKGA